MFGPDICGPGTKKVRTCDFQLQRQEPSYQKSLRVIRYLS